jgi:iron complex outermembrane receptor protein
MVTIRHAVGTAVRAVTRRSLRSNWVSWLGLVGAATYAVGLVGLSSPASAQEPPAASSSAGGTVSLEEVTVTGSRIKRTTDFNTPTPTTVIDSATMESLGLVNVGQAATFAPSNVSTFTPANTGNSNFFTGSYIADLRGLNPYFGSRTLVLLDGQRVVNSNQGDSFDLNLVPQVLVSRIDTVTGGASAAYGSGAIAGVVNVILDNKLEGGKLTGDFYQTSQSDGRDRHFGAAYGHGLFDNRVHLLIGGEYENSDAVGCEFARSWCATNTGSYELGSTPPSSGSADILGYGSDVRSNFNSGTGVLYNLSNFGGYHGAPGPVNVTPDGTATQPATAVLCRQCAGRSRGTDLSIRQSPGPGEPG